MLSDVFSFILFTLNSFWMFERKHVWLVIKVFNLHYFEVALYQWRCTQCVCSTWSTRTSIPKYWCPLPSRASTYSNTSSAAASSRSKFRKIRSREAASTACRKHSSASWENEQEELQQPEFNIIKDWAICQNKSLKEERLSYMSK